MLLSVEVGWQYDTNHIPTGASKPLTEPALPSFLPLLYTNAAIWLYGLGLPSVQNTAIAVRDANTK